MEEWILSGYCFQIDEARIVSAESEHGRLLEIDCCYERCIHRGKCEIGKQISARLAASGQR